MAEEEYEVVDLQTLYQDQQGAIDEDSQQRDDYSLNNSTNNSNYSECSESLDNQIPANDSFQEDEYAMTQEDIALFLQIDNNNSIYSSSSNPTPSKETVLLVNDIHTNLNYNAKSDNYNKRKRNYNSARKTVPQDPNNTNNQNNNHSTKPTPKKRRNNKKNAENNNNNHTSSDPTKKDDDQQQISNDNNNSSTMRKRNNRYSVLPSFKKIPGTDFIVDGFKYKSSEYKNYFLSHFHSDHYGGLTKGFQFGTVYCSIVTGRLVIHQLRVDPKYIVMLEMNKTYTIEDTEVTLLDANHCPGAALFLFNVKGSYYLHTGDFRFHPSMKEYPVLQNIKLEGLFLDNTFCDPKYTFPSQMVAIQNVLDVVERTVIPVPKNSNNNNNSNANTNVSGGNTLILVGTYTIGKEKILLALANTFHTKIYVTQSKYAIFKCLDVDMDLFTMDPHQSFIHVVSMGEVNFTKMAEFYSAYYPKYQSIIGFQPTGWAFGKSINSMTKREMGPFTIYGVPYSEHSSYEELRHCIAWWKPKQIIPTVDCDTQEKVKVILSHFRDLCPEQFMSDKSTLFPYLFKSVLPKVKDNIVQMFSHSSSTNKNINNSSKSAKKNQNGDNNNINSNSNSSSTSFKTAFFNLFGHQKKSSSNNNNNNNNNNHNNIKHHSPTMSPRNGPTPVVKQEPTNHANPILLDCDTPSNSNSRQIPYLLEVDEITEFGKEDKKKKKQNEADQQQSITEEIVSDDDEPVSLEDEDEDSQQMLDFEDHEKPDSMHPPTTTIIKRENSNNNISNINHDEDSRLDESWSSSSLNESSLNTTATTNTNTSNISNTSVEIIDLSSLEEYSDLPVGGLTGSAQLERENSTGSVQSTPKQTPTSTPKSSSSSNSSNSHNASQTTPRSNRKSQSSTPTTDNRQQSVLSFFVSPSQKNHTHS